MAENLISKGQRVLTPEGRKRWDEIFKKGKKRKEKGEHEGNRTR